MLSLEDQKSINLFTIKHLNERLRLDSGSVFHVRAGRYIYTKDGTKVNSPTRAISSVL